MELSEMRVIFDQIDDELLDLFLKRMALSQDVAAYKKERNIPILNRQREREILESVMEKAGAREREAYHLFATIMELSRACQAELMTGDSKVRTQIETALQSSDSVFPQTGRIACQGLEGANSQEASDKLFPRGNLMFVKTFQAVFDAVDSGLCDYGVVPIENSANGSVRAVYELLDRYGFSIIRMTRLCIRHELMAIPGAKLEDITQVHSHPQALGQCGRYLAALGNHVQTVPCGNTAMAAKLVHEAQDPTMACISSHPCAEIYGLKPLASDIQDSDNNYTRFVCIAKKPAIYQGASRMSLVIGCDNKPGALYEILAKLTAVGVNMTKLESCPVTGRNFEFVFYLEVEANLHGRGVIPMLEELERNCASFQFLGAYSEV